MENVVIYARFSSHNQTEQSIEGQLNICHEYAKRNGYKVIHEYIDRAISGTTDKRPEFQHMIRDSRNKRFKFILVYQLDRFARDRYDSAIYKQKLQKVGVRVLSAKENISDDASGVLMESVLEGMAEYYSKELAQKIKRGMNINATKCKSIGGHRIFGYNIDENKDFVINEKEAYWVNKIFEWYSKKLPIVKICKLLKDNSVTTSMGKDWDNNSITRLINNRRYIGEYSCKEIVIKDGIPRIVSDELFNACQKKKINNNHISYRTAERFFLTGKIFCGECGGNMIGDSAHNKDRSYFYYTCVNKKKRRGCKAKSIPKDELELSVVEHVRNLLTDNIISEIVDSAIEKIEKEKTNKELLNQLKIRKEECKNKIDKLLDCLIEDRISDLIMDRIDRERKNLSDIEEKIKDEESLYVDIDRESVIKKIKKIRDFDYDQPKAIEMFADTFVDAVIVYKDKKIAVILNLDNSINSEHICSDNLRLVELKRIELSTS